MKSQKISPHPLLRDHIACLWTSEHVIQPPKDCIELLPDSYIELVFSFGGEADIVSGNTKRALPQCYLVGLLSEPCRLHMRGTLKSVAARFYAWGFYSLLGRKLDGSDHTISELSAEWQDLANQLGPLVLSDDVQNAVEVLHNYLIEHALPLHFERSVIQSAIQRLLEEQGRVRIGHVADYCQLSRRQLERLFNDSLGGSPKAIARLMRFERARDQLWRDPKADLACLARDCGYTDQAHFNREFKRFSNRTPTQFVSEMLVTHELVHGAGVAFVQYN